MGRSRASYHAGLTRESIVESAIRLLQVEGLRGFSLRRLAAELEVDPMSLYSHVANKDDLLGAAVATAIATTRPNGVGQWWEQVSFVVREHRKSLKANPWVVDVAVQGQGMGSDAWTGVEATLALMNEHLTPAASARWLHLLVTFTNGFVAGERDQLRAENTQAAASLAESRPLVADAAQRSAQQADADFEAGLHALITGMLAEG